MPRRGQRAIRVPFGPLLPGDVDLPADIASYLRDVLRMDDGAEFILFDPDSKTEARATILSIRSTPPRAHVFEARPASHIAPRPIRLIQGMAKGDKMDAIVRDATELGVTHIVPAIMERSVARPADSGVRLERWQRIAREAARQCGRGDMPEIDPPTPLHTVLQRLPVDDESSSIAFCLDPRAPTPLGHYLRDLNPDTGVRVVIGPEGGLSPAELEICEKSRFLRVSMGSLILRTETVCAAFLGALMVLSLPNEG